VCSRGMAPWQKELEITALQRCRAGCGLRDQGASPNNRSQGNSMRKLALTVCFVAASGAAFGQLFTNATLTGKYYARRVRITSDLNISQTDVRPSPSARATDWTPSSE